MRKKRTGRKLLRNIYVVLGISVMLLSGCKNADENAMTQNENTDEIAETEIAGTDLSDENAEAVSEETVEHAEEDTVLAGPVTVENPGFSYYNDGSVDTDNPSAAIILKEWYRQTNDITDIDQWFAKHYAQIPGKIYEDESYRYTLGDNRMNLYSLEGDLIADLDFAQFQYGEEYKEEDFAFVRQQITHAKARDGILYAATSHDTYAASCSQNAYITAVDLSDGHVIWKTESLTCNSYNFEIIGDNIICGYGFTDEKDYLKIVDRKTGLVLEEIPVVSKIDYFILQNEYLYVRTYNTDYCFLVLPDEREVFIPEEIKKNTPEEILDYAVIEVCRDIAHYEKAGKNTTEDSWKDVVIEEARIVGITPIELGQIAVAHDVRMYLLEWRLKTNKEEEDMLVGGMSTEEIDGEQWLTEQDSSGSPYIIFAKNEKGEWEYVATTGLEIMGVDFSTPEMIERYGDSYTASAMEYYYRK